MGEKTSSGEKCGMQGKKATEDYGKFKSLEHFRALRFFEFVEFFLVFGVVKMCGAIQPTSLSSSPKTHCSSSDQNSLLSGFFQLKFSHVSPTKKAKLVRISAGLRRVLSFDPAVSHSFFVGETCKRI